MYQPSGSLDILEKRAQLMRQLRSFFYARNIMEVDVPVLGQYTVPDPYIETLHTRTKSGCYYLQSSPEFFMKRLLAAGSDSIFYLGKSFRDDVLGARHLHEFTMLEWYRLGFDDRKLMDEMSELFKALSSDTPIVRMAYYDIFFQCTQIDPHEASIHDLRTWINEHIDLGRHVDDLMPDVCEKSDFLDLIFTHHVEQQLPPHIVFIYDYPECQSALARIGCNDSGRAVAKRFEVYWGGVELANGYWELNNAEEQKARFEKNLQTRKKQNLPIIELDQCFLAAMDAGLPDCAGVALGVDRLLMRLNKVNNIHEVVSFLG